MRNHLKSLVAGVVTLGIAGVMIAAGASTASAATPPYDPDPNAYGTMTLYDAAGNVVTSGDGTNAQSPQYAVASTNPTHPVTVAKAGLFLYGPQPSVNPGFWTGTQLNANTTYPITTAPVPVSSSPFPATVNTSASKTLLVASQAFTPNPAASGLQNVFELRLVNAQIGDYAEASITINPTTGAWAQVFPVPFTGTVTTTALGVSPASPGVAPASPTLTATVSPASPTAVGSVQFFNGATSLGTSPVVAGVATKALTSVSVGTYSYTATFTPTDPTAFTSSTSSAVPYLVNAPKPTPTVALTSSSAAPNVGDPVTFTATVSAPNVPGSIQFFDGTTSLGAAGATNGSGVATLGTSALAAGAHSVTAVFVPTDLVTYNGSTSPAVLVNVLTGACTQTSSKCTDPQPFVVEVPVGSLVISTPWTTKTPFDLGPMTLNAAGTQLSTGFQAFGYAGNEDKGVTITDQRSGDLPWTASLQSSPFLSGGNAINARNLGFTGVTPTYQLGNALNASKPVLTFDTAATSPAVASTDTSTLTTGLATSRTFATAAHGAGSVYVTGGFTLNAPTSTPAGTYAGTVTFTID
jgi:Bacterial Ig-like domain (group 3)